MLENWQARTIAVDRTVSGRFDAELTVPMKGVLRQLEQNPCPIDHALVRELRSYRTDLRTGLFRPAPFTSVYASALLIDRQFTGPLYESSQDLTCEDQKFALDLVTGLEYLSDTLTRAQGAAAKGVRDQVAMELDKEVEGLPPLQANRYKFRQRGKREEMARADVCALRQDPTGGTVLMSAYNRVVDMSQGIDPLKGSGSPLLKQVWNETNVVGVVFGMELYRQVYPRAKKLFS